MAATSTYSPIREGQEEHSGDYNETAGGGCGCFRRFCFGWDDEGPSSHNYLLRESESWVAEKFKKLREVSEMAAGPKWKNLVRKIGRLCNPKRSNKETTSNLQFQYSPESYALNFAGREEEEDGQLLHSFSTRFARHASINGDQHTRFGL
ncbi:hypothetical protein F511_37602 [Dorcoceras hygrometricum]|uniref:Uncharacterized protein n=1 Tax=Dorcoceras hygrometricum TaxID=472368 RepID=A0A2Z7C4F7_9LAMI|nr:hypothetical protein F511_37602 [Dorcoceras hygrometricum]